jgi:hypothetical protein
MHREAVTVMVSYYRSEYLNLSQFLNDFLDTIKLLFCPVFW